VLPTCIFDHNDVYKQGKANMCSMLSTGLLDRLKLSDGFVISAKKIIMK